MVKNSSLEWEAVHTVVYLLSGGEGIVGDECGPGGEPPAGVLGVRVLPVLEPSSAGAPLEAVRSDEQRTIVVGL